MTGSGMAFSSSRREDRIYIVRFRWMFSRILKLSVQIENAIDDPHGAVFEDILRRISVKAFDALLTCGVRDITGFLRLTTESLQQNGIALRIATELLRLQQQVNEQIIESHGTDDGAITGDATGIEEQQEQDENKDIVKKEEEGIAFVKKEEDDEDDEEEMSCFSFLNCCC